MGVEMKHDDIHHNKLYINDSHKRNSKMKLSYLQCYTEYEMITYIIDDENHKYYCFAHTDLDISEIDYDPRKVEHDGEVFSEDDFSMLSGEDDEIDIIGQFIVSDCVVGKYTSIKTESDGDPTTILLYWNRYRELDGKLIENVEDYQYYYELFYMLTHSKVGSYCPIPNSIGFAQFENIINVMCKDSGKKIRGSLEFTKFFRSIDDVHPYS
jgi:hypothetical protein